MEIPTFKVSNLRKVYIDDQTGKVVTRKYTDEEKEEWINSHITEVNYVNNSKIYAKSNTK